MAWRATSLFTFSTVGKNSAGTCWLNLILRVRSLDSCKSSSSAFPLRPLAITSKEKNLKDPKPSHISPCQCLWSSDWNVHSVRWLLMVLSMKWCLFVVYVPTDQFFSWMHLFCHLPPVLWNNIPELTYSVHWHGAVQNFSVQNFLTCGSPLEFFWKKKSSIILLSNKYWMNTNDCTALLTSVHSSSWSVNCSHDRDLSVSWDFTSKEMSSIRLLTVSLDSGMDLILNVATSRPSLGTYPLLLGVLIIPRSWEAFYVWLFAGMQDTMLAVLSQVLSWC